MLPDYLNPIELLFLLPPASKIYCFMIKDREHNTAAILVNSPTTYILCSLVSSDLIAFRLSIRFTSSRVIRVLRLPGNAISSNISTKWSSFTQLPSIAAGSFRHDTHCHSLILTFLALPIALTVESIFSIVLIIIWKYVRSELFIYWLYVLRAVYLLLPQSSLDLK